MMLIVVFPILNQDLHRCFADVAYAIVEVEDVIYLSGDVDDSFEGTHTPTDMMLSAKWSPKSGIPPVW